MTTRLAQDARPLTVKLRTIAAAALSVLSMPNSASATALGRQAGASSCNTNSPISGHSFYVPADTEPHAGTIMTWPMEDSVEGDDSQFPGADLKGTRREVADIALAIAKYEPVEMFVLDPQYDENYKNSAGSASESVSDTSNASDASSAATANDDCGDLSGTALGAARELLGKVKNVKIHVTPNVASLWARDTAPVFVHEACDKPVNITWQQGAFPSFGYKNLNTSSGVVGIDLGFNQWGKKFEPTTDAYFAGSAAQALHKSFLRAPFTGEGGALVFDGQGTLLATESSILNPNRNPGIDKATMDKYFEQVFGVTKVIWIPGFAGGDLTDDHIDGIARFTAPGSVLVSKPFAKTSNDDILADYYDVMRLVNGTKDAQGRRIKVFELPEPDPKKVLPGYTEEQGVSVAYVNYHVVNGAVIVAKFGDKQADDNAAKILAQHYPGRKVEQVLLHNVAIQGGGIHCSTQQFF